MEFLNFSERREIARNSWCFSWKSACHGVLTATKALLRSSCGILWRSYGVFIGDSMRSHDAFTALSRRSHCMHCAVTAFALCFNGVCTALTAWYLKKYANIRNCSNQNLNPVLNTKIWNNYMCNIKNNQNTREHIVNRVSSYFLKRWPLSNWNWTKIM